MSYTKTENRMVIYIKKKKSDAEEFYQEYLNYQNGDKSSLERVFKTNDRPQRLAGKYYSLYQDEYEGDEWENADDDINNISNNDDMNKDDIADLDNVPDAEFIKAQIQDEEERHSAKVEFRFECLNRILSNAKWAYSREYADTGYRDGVRVKGGYRKFHNGKYNISDIKETMIEIIIGVFQRRLISNKPIVDPGTLLGNIKYHLEKEIGKDNDTTYENISEFKYEINDIGEEVSYSRFDKVAEKNWIDSQREIDRLLIYSDSLKWIIRNDIHKLFREDSDDIHAVIDAILEYTQMFEPENQEGLTKNPYKELQKYISYTTGRNILGNNISMDLKVIEQRMLDHLMYSLNYEIVNAKNRKIPKNEIKRILKELDCKRYFKLFGRESMRIYDHCVDYINEAIRYPCKKFLLELRKYDDTVIPILERERGKKKYDMINLLTYNLDIVGDDIYKVSFNIAETLISYYKNVEHNYIYSFLDQYNIINRFKTMKSKYWQAAFNGKKKRLNLKFLADGDIKCPVNIKFKKKELLVCEGYENYYFCNTENKCCYCVPKDCRVIRKSDKKHKIFCCESA